MHPSDPARCARRRRGSRWFGRSHADRSVVFRIVLFLAGLVLVLAGALLGLVPLLPGFPLGLVGVLLLSASSRRVQRLLRRLARRLPRGVRDRIRP